MTDRKLLKPEGWRYGFMTAAGGEKIRYGYVAPPTPSTIRGTVIFTGGYGRHIEHYYEALNNWRDRGFAVYAMDWYGQGGSGRDNPAEPRKPSSRDFGWHADMFHQFINIIVRPAHQRPVFLCSHSKGGNIMLRYMHKYRNHADYRVDGAILAAPLIDINTYIKHTGFRQFLGAASALGFSDVLPQRTERFRDFFDSVVFGIKHLDDRRRTIHDRYERLTKDFEVGMPTVGWLRSAFHSSDIVRDESFLKSIATPTLIITPTSDSLVCIKAQRRAAAHMQDAKQKEIRNAKHGIWYDKDEIQAQLWDEVDRFVAGAENRFYGKLSQPKKPGPKYG